MRKSLAVAIIHAAIVLSVWANYAWQQRNLPRAWTKAVPYDPYDLLRGRYVQIRITTLVDPGTHPDGGAGKGRLFVQGGRLHLQPAECCVLFLSGRLNGAEVTLTDPVRFYIPEGIPDPSRLEPGDELWVELSVPADAAPRPVQLARKKKDGSWLPMRLDSTRAGTK